MRSGSRGKAVEVRHGKSLPVVARRVLFWRVQEVEARQSWSGWHVPSGPGPVLQGSHGSVGHVGEGEGVMVNQGSLGTARRGLLGYRKATQSGRVRSGHCLARQVGLAQRKAVRARLGWLVEGVMAWKRMAVRSRQGPARTGPSSRVIARQRKAVRAS